MHTLESTTHTQAPTYKCISDFSRPKYIEAGESRKVG